MAYNIKNDETVNAEKRLACSGALPIAVTLAYLPRESQTRQQSRYSTVVVVSSVTSESLLISSRLMDSSDPPQVRGIGSIEQLMDVGPVFETFMLSVTDRHGSL